MKLYLAMSCLQGRPMRAAFDELAQLGVDGIQLTPGNAPTVSFADYVAASGTATRTHHGYTPDAIRSEVWSDRFRLNGAWQSVHPPRLADAAWLPDGDAEVCLETMYPGYPLGSGASLDAAMDAGVRLAVDISHVFIQRTQGEMREKTWRRLQDYERIEEVHISANDGVRDRHAPVSPNSYGLAWARRRSTETAIPAILECYLHKLSLDERLRQLEIVRGQ